MSTNDPLSSNLVAECRTTLEVEGWIPTERLLALIAECERLDGLINNPHTVDFIEAVRTEAAHQRERWGSEHDGGKTDADWFWLIGYLAGKALNKPEKQLHHIITTAAACLNWHASKTGASTSMRPGIERPADETKPSLSTKGD